uniref:Uncharacterized protein n=1 Tax=Arundo donax TaxID=35708 RepID=A0A0A8ZEN9_ARUDO
MRMTCVPGAASVSDAMDGCIWQRALYSPREVGLLGLIYLGPCVCIFAGSVRLRASQAHE